MIKWTKLNKSSLTLSKWRNCVFFFISSSISLYEIHFFLSIYLEQTKEEKKTADVQNIFQANNDPLKS